MTSPEQNKAIAQRFFREVTADPEAVMEELFASDYIGHSRALLSWTVRV